MRFYIRVFHRAHEEFLQLYHKDAVLMHFLLVNKLRRLRGLNLQELIFNRHLFHIEEKWVLRRCFLGFFLYRELR